jgi:hypothetical protein
MYFFSCAEGFGGYGFSCLIQPVASEAALVFTFALRGLAHLRS